MKQRLLIRSYSWFLAKYVLTMIILALLRHMKFYTFKNEQLLQTLFSKIQCLVAIVFRSFSGTKDYCRNLYQKAWIWLFGRWFWGSKIQILLNISAVLNPFCTRIGGNWWFLLKFTKSWPGEAKTLGLLRPFQLILIFHRIQLLGW